MSQPSVTLPEAVASVPVLSDLDNWDVARCEGALAALLPNFAKMRLCVGAVLYHLRTLEDDAAFRAHEDGYADQIGVDARTLRRWRQIAEEVGGLPPATKRAVAQRSKGQDAPKGHDVPKPEPKVVKPDGVTHAAPEQLTFSLSDHKAAIMAEPPVAGAKEWTLTELSALRAWVDEAIAIKTPAARAKSEPWPDAPTVDGHRHQAKASKGGSGLTRCECGAVKVGNRWVKR